MSRIKEYRNTPAPQLLEKIGATNLTVADAVAEIVANSFDAAVEGQPTVVEVDVQSDEVSVVDSGVGMAENVLVEATKLGVDMSDVVAKPKGSKGHFGLGMKTACASIGRWWAVYTRPIGLASEFRVVFDLAEWQRRPNAPEAWTIAVEEVDLPADGPLGNREHGTAVVVRQLRQKDPLPGAVLQKLGEAFKPHLEGDDSIVVNGDPATPYNYDFVPNSIVPIDLAFGAPDQYRITGWVAIDKQTHNAGDYGFNIYRHGQLVETWYQGWFAAHLMTSRIIGEVHMDFIEATFFKQGLQQSELWRQASAEMKEFMKPVVRASQDLSRKGNVNSPVIAQGIVNDMYRGVGLDPPDTNEPVDEGDSPTGGPTTGESKHELPRLHVNLESLVLEDGTCVSISLVEKAFPTSGTPFDFVFSSAGRSLQAVLNTNHPLHQKSRDVEQLRTLAIADCILRYLVRECAMTGDKAAEIRNIWILAAMGVSTQRGCD